MIIIHFFLKTFVYLKKVTTFEKYFTCYPAVAMVSNMLTSSVTSAAKLTKLLFSQEKGHTGLL